MISNDVKEAIDLLWEHTQPLGKVSQEDYANAWLALLNWRDAQPQAPESELAVNEYQVAGGGPHDTEDVRLCRRRQLEGDDKWAIYKRSWVLSRDGEWEFEPLPSGRDDAFIARCRFDTPQEALAIYRRTQGGRQR